MILFGFLILTVLQLACFQDIIYTIAGTGTVGYSGDGGAATSATLNGPAGITLDSSGNVYFADFLNNRVRKITISTGIISTFAGDGGTACVDSCFSGDGSAATSAALFSPYGISSDTSNIYIADRLNHRIRKVVLATNIITTIAGTGTSSFSGDGGDATSAALYSPQGIATDTSGALYISDTGNNRIRKVSNGIITTIAGSGSTTPGTYGDLYDGSSAISAIINNPISVVVDSSSNVFIADSGNNRIRKVTVSTGIITTFAGSGAGLSSAGFSGDGGVASSAKLFSPAGVTLDNNQNMYIVDAKNYRIRKINSLTSVITTLAGTGATSSSGDGDVATSASLNDPYGIVLASNQYVYFTEKTGNKIRVIQQVTDAPTSSPTVTPSTAIPSYLPSEIPTVKPTIVPSGIPTLIPTIEPTIEATTKTPSNYPSMSPNTVFIISTIVGTGSTSYNGDDISATSATLYYPWVVALDSVGKLIYMFILKFCLIFPVLIVENVYIADNYHHRIRKVTVSTGIITTVAGTGSSGFSGDGGAATSAGLNNPIGVALDSSGTYTKLYLIFNFVTPHFVQEMFILRTLVIIVFAK